MVGMCSGHVLASEVITRPCGGGCEGNAPLWPGDQLSLGSTVMLVAATSPATPQTREREKQFLGTWIYPSNSKVTNQRGAMVILHLFSNFSLEITLLCN